METFKLPYIPFKPNTVPTREQVKQGFHALRTNKQKLIYAMLAVSGLRVSELRDLHISDIDLETRCIKPRHDSSTKRAFCTFWNDEVDALLRKYLKIHKRELENNGGRLFRFSDSSITRMARLTERKAGMRINPRVLRRFFCAEMGRLGVSDRYVDAFCGRVPKSVLARYYTDFSPERLKEIYDKADIRVLS
jgi:integrase